MLKVAIFDDMMAARGEMFHIHGLAVDVYAHADDAAELCRKRLYDVVFMDYAMGAGHKSGATVIRELRGAGFAGTIVATSSDPVANTEMQVAGADEALPKKAHLRSYLVHLAARHPMAMAEADEPGDGGGEPGES